MLVLGLGISKDSMKVLGLSNEGQVLGLSLGFGLFQGLALKFLWLEHCKGLSSEQQLVERLIIKQNLLQ